MRESVVDLARRRIRVVTGPSRGRSFELGGGRLTIGRAADADIRVQDPGVSRYHARIIGEGAGRHVLVDLGSTNGTLVGGVEIDEHPLDLGNLFTISGSTFVYEIAPRGDDGEDTSPVDPHELGPLVVEGGRPGPPSEPEPPTQTE